MAIAAYSSETINVIAIEATIPTNAVCHEKYLKVGLKFNKNFKYLIKPNLK